MRFSDTSTLFERKSAPLSDAARIMRKLNMDGQLLGGLLLICGVGLVVLYSAVGEDMDLLVQQCVRLFVALIAMFVVAQLPPDVLRRWTPWGYLFGLVLLVLVLMVGEVSQGAKRWLHLGIRFQPSEIMKLAVPMMAAWYLHERQLPPGAGAMFIIVAVILVPASLIAVQPDLGTSVLIGAAGFLVLVLAGMSARLMALLALLSVPGAMVLWNFVMADYQKLRVVTLLNPNRPPEPMAIFD